MGVSNLNVEMARKYMVGLVLAAESYMRARRFVNFELQAGWSESEIYPNGISEPGHCWHKRVVTYHADGHVLRFGYKAVFKEGHDAAGVTQRALVRVEPVNWGGDPVIFTIPAEDGYVVPKMGISGFVPHSAT